MTSDEMYELVTEKIKSKTKTDLLLMGDIYNNNHYYYMLRYCHLLCPV